ncbi:acetyl-CoA carboxylase biotin carboxylase subunit family protein [Clostridium sp. AUH-JLR23]|uniref:ATP-grasp domain-containing protein n=1 Tax=Clostridium sp. AUH-JLR23 TaxID=1505062 RepID=UPI00356595FD
MEKLVIIGAGEFQLPLIQKAKSLNYETHVFAWEEGAVGKEVADYFYPISITEKQEILDICKKIQPKGVVSIGSDLAVLTVNYIARNLGLVCNPKESDLITTNKYLMRDAFQNNSIPVPKFIKTDRLIQENEIEDFTYPLIVKPTDRSGSRGIKKVNSFEDLNLAISIAINNSFEKCAIVEEYINGEEYSCECISFESKHNCLAFTKKYTTGAPHFIETGHLEPADLDNEQITYFSKEIFKALDALKIQYGASHCEFKITDDGKIKIIEIGARMGGDCIGSHLVQLSTSNDYIKMVIDVACGKRIDEIKNSIKQNAFIKFIFNQNDLNILEKLKTLYPEKIIYVSNIEKIDNTHRITDSSSRFGFYIGVSLEKEIIETIITSNDHRQLES